MTRHATRTLGLGLVLAALLMLPQAAGAAGTVAIGSATRSGDTLTVSGTSTYTDQAFVTLGTDGTGDALVPAQGPLGGDLTKFAARVRSTGHLSLEWTVAELPPVLNGSPTGFVYGFAFCVNVESCFEMDTSRMGLAAGNTTGMGQLWRCANPACVPGEQTSISATIGATIDGTAKTITTNISASQLGGLKAGDSITPVEGLTTVGPVFVGTGDLSVGTYFYNNDDGLTLDDGAFTVAGKQVSVAVAAPGLDPASVTYTNTVAPNGTGAYAAAVNVAGKTGDHAVYVRACLGAGNCAYATQAVAL